MRTGIDLRDHYLQVRYRINGQNRVHYDQCERYPFHGAEIRSVYV